MVGENRLITCEEARAIVAVKHAGLSRPEDEFALGPTGYDGGERWVIICHRNVFHVLFATVDKKTGEYQEHKHIPSLKGSSTWLVAEEPPKMDQAGRVPRLSCNRHWETEQGGPAVTTYSSSQPGQTPLIDSS